MPTWAWILIVAAVVVVAIAAVLLLQQRQRAGLRERFGPEYDRVVEEADDRRRAERELADRADRRDKLDIRPLSADQRAEYAARWEGVQSAFVDRPREAVVHADELIVEVMERRGYPVDSFDDRASLVSADHPDVVEHYRSAHAVSTQGGAASTEDMRQAFVHYRALFDAMLADTDAETDAETDIDRDVDERRDDLRADVDVDSTVDGRGEVRTEGDVRTEPADRIADDRDEQERRI